MKTSNKSSFIAGIILLVLAAFLTISLLLLPLNFGINSLGQKNYFFIIGFLLYNTYGFSSILIPLFLLIAGLSCFASIWTSQKTMRLLTAVIPFFTAVITEKICRSIYDMGNDSSTLVKLIIVILTGLALIGVEILGAGVVAEKINQKLFHSGNTSVISNSSSKIGRFVSVNNRAPQTKKINTNMELHEYQNEQELKEKLDNPTFVPTVFDTALTNVQIKTEEQVNTNPASILTQEEYALLTTQEEESEPEELEWHDLPPVPDKLPPEYDEEYVEEEEVENDEILDFPPKENTSPYSSRIVLNENTEVQKASDDTEEIDDTDFSVNTKTVQSSKYNSRISLFDEEETEDDTEIQEDEVEDSEEFDDSEELVEDQIFNQIADQENEGIVLTSAAASVFDDMEKDIQKNIKDEDLKDIVIKKQEEKKPKVPAKKGPYVISTDLLTAYKDDQYWIIDEETKQASMNLKRTLSEFNIDADIIGIKKGPVVTMFELLPAPGVKLSKIVALADNIALALAAQSVRIVAPIPGKQAVGIEVPNKNRSIVGFREIIEMNLTEWSKMAVPVVLGKDILGKAQIIDLTKTPHMLIAGATGSGKSVCVNTLILSILYKRSYKDVKLILVDPKVVELKLYNNIPHLLTPVITEPKKALQALQYCLCEMERRYALLDGLGVRDISSYNQRIKERNICTEKLPYIVVIIDEFADLMATSGKELESTVARLTAMSRAVGIHLVLATQRPSVNVITGLIKANIPSRIAFMVASRTDSNIIIDSVGAEKLLGRGDMLYASAVDPYPVRIQGTFVSDQEVEDVVDAVKEYGEPDYIDDEIFVEDDEGSEGGVDLFGNSYNDEDPLYEQALDIVVQAGKASASYIQRRLKIGYNRAARLVEEMEERGIVGPANGSKPREIIHIP